MIRILVKALDSTLAELVQNTEAVDRRSIPATADAFRYAATKLILPSWKSVALENTLIGFPYKLKNPSGGYARSIQAKQLSTPS